jgi:hypothetical protein
MPAKHLKETVVNRTVFVFFAFALCGLLVGCGSKGPATGSVEGQITHNNQPVTQGNVVYENAERGWAYVAPLDSEGRYRLANVNLAEFKVCIKPVEAKAADETGGAAGVIPTAAGADPANIPTEYRSSQTTRLKATVVEGSNSFNYDLAKPK